jgi:small nuclear ribonucleoprotein (snRNP)-like protein
VLISLRNNKKLLARVKAFDRHSNMVLENVKEVRFLLDCAGGRSAGGRSEVQVVRVKKAASMGWDLQTVEG